jgi:hypothetical protein
MVAFVKHIVIFTVEIVIKWDATVSHFHPSLTFLGKAWNQQLELNTLRGLW